ncbi:hypothetical protein GW17_00036405 [Ensete ventricosum]|nr:hypothetical protein GW17_00036405 [Ensete ventricosum]
MWYCRLRPSSIFCFNQLAKEFELNFLANARPKSTVMSILGMNQKGDEPLAQFVTRFAAEIPGIPDASSLLISPAFCSHFRSTRSVCTPCFELATMNHFLFTIKLLKCKKFCPKRAKFHPNLEQVVDSFDRLRDCTVFSNIFVAYSSE